MMEVDGRSDLSLSSQIQNPPQENLRTKPSQDSVEAKAGGFHKKKPTLHMLEDLLV
jgi:hypothetical protein